LHAHPKTTNFFKATKGFSSFPFDSGSGQVGFKSGAPFSVQQKIPPMLLDFKRLQRVVSFFLLEKKRALS